MIKRIFDVVISASLIAILSPVLLFLALLVKCDSPGPAFFRQQRVAQGGGTFRIFKFRSMVADADRKGPQVTAERDSRITRIGRFLRRSKLDELPQLFNVLWGDMSLVGPRPEVPAYVAHWSEEDRKIILSLKPGITDPASIVFRDEERLLAGAADPERYYIETILPQKLAIYRRYVKERSFANDIRILMQTAARITGL